MCIRPASSISSCSPPSSGRLAPLLVPVQVQSRYSTILYSVHYTLYTVQLSHIHPPHRACLQLPTICFPNLTRSHLKHVSTSPRKEKEQVTIASLAPSVASLLLENVTHARTHARTIHIFPLPLPFLHRYGYSDTLHLHRAQRVADRVENEMMERRRERA